MRQLFTWGGLLALLGCKLGVGDPSTSVPEAPSRPLVAPVADATWQKSSGSKAGTSSEDLHNLELLRTARREEKQKVLLEPVAFRKKLLEGTPATILDVRDKQDWEQGSVRIPGSIRLDPAKPIPPSFWPRDQLTVLVCSPGKEVEVGKVDELRKLGFTDAHILTDGMAGWRRAGGNVELK